MWWKAKFTVSLSLLQCNRIVLAATVYNSSLMPMMQTESYGITPRVLYNFIDSLSIILA